MEENRKTKRLASQPVVGRLQEHGRAPYQFRSGEDLTYYIRLVTTEGVKTLWGKDLERALLAGATKPRLGDMIGARRTARETVTLLNRHRDGQGNIRTQSEHHAHRFRWEVEKLQFFAERVRRARLARDAQMRAREDVKRRPELRSTFLSLRAAEKLAERRIANPEDRAKFLAMVREAMEASTRRGEPISDLPIRRNEPDRRSIPTTRKRTPEDPTR